MIDHLPETNHTAFNLITNNTLSRINSINENSFIVFNLLNADTTGPIYDLVELSVIC